MTLSMGAWTMLDSSLVAIAPLTMGGMLLAYEIGRRLGRRRLAREPDEGSQGVSAVEGGTFGLMGLLIAFTFSGASGRYDARKRYVVDEANAIGTAYLRLDLLPAAVQPQLRESFVRYTDLRLEVYSSSFDLERSLKFIADANVAGQVIWNQAIAGSRDCGPQVQFLLMPALNEMLDLANLRNSAAQYFHPPGIIFWMLGVTALACALVAGHGTASTRSRTWVHTLAFVVTLSLTVYVVVDLEFPRAGFIRVDAVDQVLRNARAAMK
jgi:hypothetical protein